MATLLLLQTRGRMTAEALAAELEVSVRTVYRDIEALGGAGVPVYGSPGKDGGFRLVDGYRTQLTGLAAPEAESLFLMGVPAAAAELGYSEALSAAQLKLLASLPTGQRAHAQRMAERFHLDAPPWYHDHERPDFLAPIASAVWERQRITIDYQRWAQPRHVTVVLEPLGLVLKAGQWYLVARSVDGLRTYRISRVSNLTDVGETFEPPAGFDLRAFWHDHLADFDARRYAGVATVMIAPEVFDALPHVFEPNLVRAVQSSAGRPDADGWVRAEIPFESIPYTAGLLLQLGAGVVVLAPCDLRDHIRTEAANITRLYDHAHACPTPTSNSGMPRTGSPPGSSRPSRRDRRGGGLFGGDLEDHRELPPR